MNGHESKRALYSQCQTWTLWLQRQVIIYHIEEHIVVLFVCWSDRSCETFEVSIVQACVYNGVHKSETMLLKSEKNDSGLN